MSDPEHEVTPEPAPIPASGATWRRLAVRAAYSIPLLFILLMIGFRFVDPFLLVFCVVFGTLGFWASRGGRASVLVLGIIAVMFIAMNIPFLGPSLTAPASFIDFLLAVFLLLGALTVAAAAFQAFRTGEVPSSGPAIMVRAVAALAVVAIVVAVVSRVTYDGGSQQEGDIAVVTEDVEFKPETIESDGGTVSVFITNNDPTLHTFTIDELDVDVVIPQNATARIEFEADAGEYRFYCIPHETTMEGTLEVR